MEQVFHKAEKVFEACRAWFIKPSSVDVFFRGLNSIQLEGTRFGVMINPAKKLIRIDH